LPTENGRKKERINGVKRWNGKKIGAVEKKVKKGKIFYLIVSHKIAVSVQKGRPR
jgi:hypothetical protein